MQNSGERSLYELPGPSARASSALWPAALGG